MRSSLVTLLFAVSLGLVFTTGCDEILGKDPTPTPPPTATVVPPPTPTTAPLPTPSTKPPLAPGASIVVGGELRTRGDPSTAGPVTGVVQDGQTVNVVAVVPGENWLVGSQTWVAATPAWASEWLQLENGSYVYSAFVFRLGADETSPLLDTGGKEKWIDVNLSTQTIAAMVGDQAIHIALATTGSPEFPTPKGTQYIEPDGRIVLEKMTATQAGYAPGQAQYDVERVLFVQYFDRKGDGIHMNYWRPEEVYGAVATSHGCVGLQLHDAQYFWLFGAPGMRIEVHD